MRRAVCPAVLMAALSIACGSSSMSGTPSSPTPTPSATTGSLQAGIRSGTVVRGLGYTVTVDGSLAQTGHADDRVTFSGLSVGEHTVALATIGNNCSPVAENNPRRVTVAANAMATAEFDVVCTTASPATQPTR
jgi:hypothetical protein